MGKALDELLLGDDEHGGGGEEAGGDEGFHGKRVTGDFFPILRCRAIFNFPADGESREWLAIQG